MGQPAYKEEPREAVELPPRYTYADYAAWPEDERWELIEGVPYDMSPAPSTLHQSIVGAIHAQLYTSLRGKSCRVFIAPFDVRLPRAGETPGRASSTVQPDLVVVCNPKKIDERGCKGAPDFIIEILSPSTAAKDQIEKVALYEKHRVKEYWVVHPDDRLLTIRILNTKGKYGIPRVVKALGRVKIATLQGLEIDLDAIWE